MAKKLSPWCKEAKKKMIDMDLEVTELASSLGLTRPYVSSVLNGRVYSPVAVKRLVTICKYRMQIANNKSKDIIR